MAKSQNPKVFERQALTANDLRHGHVVFYGTDGGWHSDMRHAAIADDAETTAALTAAGQAAERANLVVGSYLFAVTGEGAGLQPAHIREQMRTRGPSVRPDLGYQAGQAPQPRIKSVVSARATASRPLHEL